MYIKSLLIYDYIEKRINKFEFEKKVNLFVSESNKHGKSSLIKSIYYSLGFQIKIWPTSWQYENMIFQLTIVHDNIEYLITRHNDLFYINEKELILNEKEFSMWLQKLVNLKIQIKEKKSKKLVDVYASELLMPFYIDQDKSWHGYVFSKTSDSYGRYTSPVRNLFDFYFNINSIKRLNLEVEKSNYGEKINSFEKQLQALNLLEDTHRDIKPSYYLSNNISPKEYISNDQMNIYLLELNKLNNALSEYDVKILNTDKLINTLSRNNFELNKLKNNYLGRLKDIEYTCIYCNSNLTEEQSITRLKIRNNIYEIEENINHNIKEIEVLKDNREQFTDYKDAFLNKRKEINHVLKNREIESVEILIDAKVQQELFNTLKETENRILNDRNECTRKIANINKEIASERKLSRMQQKEITTTFTNFNNEYELFLNSNPHNDIKLSDIKFGEFKEITGSGNDGNIKMLAIYTLYANLINQYSRIELPFGMDSFLKNETAKDFKIFMFSFLSKYYLTIPTQIFFSIIEENLQYIDNEIDYNIIHIEKPILKEITDSNRNLLSGLSFISNS